MWSYEHEKQLEDLETFNINEVMPCPRRIVVCMFVRIEMEIYHSLISFWRHILFALKNLRKLSAFRHRKVEFLLFFITRDIRRTKFICSLFFYLVIIISWFMVLYKCKRKMLPWEKKTLNHHLNKIITTLQKLIRCLTDISKGVSIAASLHVVSDTW